MDVMCEGFFGKSNVQRVNVFDRNKYEECLVQKLVAGEYIDEGAWEYIDGNMDGRVKVRTPKGLYRACLQSISKYGNAVSLNWLDVSEVSDMSNLFEPFADFNGDVSRWDVSGCYCMRAMFWGCRAFNCDISGWDVSNVVNMNEMFHWCTGFDQDLSGWDVSKVYGDLWVFAKCPITEEHKPKFNVD